MTSSPKSTIPLRRLFNIVNGSTPSSGDDDCWEGDVLWATPEDVSRADGVIRSTLRMLTQWGYASCGTTLVPADSLVLTTRAPIGNVAIAERVLCTNQGCKSLVPRAQVDTRYYYYVLVSSTDQLQALGQGSTFRELSSGKLAAFQVPYPSIDEQRSIAVFLDRKTAAIDALIAKKERLIELLQEKRKALIIEGVTKGLDRTINMSPSGIGWVGDIPHHWQVAPIYSRYEVQLGKMLDEKRITGSHEARYLRNVDVQWDRINTENLPLMDFDRSDRKRYALRDGDLLVCEGGEVGRSAVWSGDVSGCYYQKALHRLRPWRVHESSTRFLFYLMFAASKVGVFIAGGNPNTIDHLTADTLRMTRFAWPPYDEQKAIAQLLDDIGGRLALMAEKVSRSVKILREYRQALISAAVTGKLDIPAEDAA